MSQQAPVHRLRASQLAGSAFATWFGSFADWLRAIAFPLAILFLVYFVLWQFLQSQSLEEISQQSMAGSFRDTATVTVNTIFFTLLGVTWHRYALLGERPRLLPTLGMPHLRYILWLLIIGLLLFLTFAVIAALVAGSLARGGMPLPAGVLAVVGFSGLLYLFGRVSPMFPAFAVGDRLSLLGAWRLTRGHGLAIFFGYLLVLVPLFFLAALLVTFVMRGILSEQLEPGQVMSAAELQAALLDGYWSTQSVYAAIALVGATLGVGVASAIYQGLK